MKKGLIAIVLITAIMIVTTGCSKKDAAASSGTEEKYEMVFAHASTEQTLIHTLSVKFKEEVESKSGGRISIQIYPNMQLGADREAFEGVQMGNITFTVQSTAPQVNFVKEAGVFDLPFLFPNKAIARKVLDGPFKGEIASYYDSIGVKLLGFGDQGFRQLTLNKMVRKPSDLSGIKLRTMENPNHMATWRALGANPTPVPFNEVYLALQQKMVDGQENPYEYIVTMKFYEQQKYVINTNHIFQAMGFVMNKGVYDSLPADLKKVIDDAALVAIDFERSGIDKKDSLYIDTIKNAGLEVVDLNANELAEFGKATEGVYDLIKKNIGEEIVDSIVGSVKDNS